DRRIIAPVLSGIGLAIFAAFALYAFVQVLVPSGPQTGVFVAIIVLIGFVVGYVSGARLVPVDIQRFTFTRDEGRAILRPVIVLCAALSLTAGIIIVTQTLEFHHSLGNAVIDGVVIFGSGLLSVLSLQAVIYLKAQYLRLLGLFLSITSIILLLIPPTADL